MFFEIIEYWLLLELINYLIFVYIYTFKIKPKKHICKKPHPEKIINNIKDSSKEDIIFMIKTAISYKITENDINNIDELSRNEMIKMYYNYLYAKNYNPNKPLNLYTECELEEYESIIDLINCIEKKCNITFKANNNKIRYIFFEWGNTFIEFNFRPFFIICLVRIVTNIVHMFMTKYYKFVYYQCKTTGIGYLYKNNDIYKKDLLFIHGFGIGYLPYLLKIPYLSYNFNLTIMILPEISNYNWFDDYLIYFPNIQHIQQSLINYLEYRNIDKINVMAHSFGTYIYKIVEEINKFDKVILIDPIIFWVGSAQLRNHIENPDAYGIIESIINRFVYKCIHLKYICYRYMWGHDFWVYDTKDIENKNILFVLQENDHVIAVDKIYNFIKNKNINYYILKNCRHSTIFFDNKYNKIFKEIMEFIN